MATADEDKLETGDVVEVWWLVDAAPDQDNTMTELELAGATATIAGAAVALAASVLL
jgi:hypothetical protein